MKIKQQLYIRQKDKKSHLNFDGKNIPIIDSDCELFHSFFTHLNFPVKNGQKCRN